MSSNYFASNQQYQTSGTEQPTVTLGTHLQVRASKFDSKTGRNQNRRHTPFAQSELQMKNQYLKQLQICHAQIETLKQQIQMQQNQKNLLEDTINELKKDLSLSSKQNNRLFQENQKNKQLVEKLKIDNKSKQMEISSFKGERKVLNNNLTNIDALNRDIKLKMADKDRENQRLTQQNRKQERTHSECKSKIEELERAKTELEVQKKELLNEARAGLERYISYKNQFQKIQYELKNVNQLNNHMKTKILELQKQREQLYAKFGYQANDERGNLSDSSLSNYHPQKRSMIEIQSYMKQIQNLLDLKKDEQEKKQKNYSQIKIAIQCLEKNL